MSRVKLQDLLKKIDWVMIEKNRFNNKADADKVYVGFYPSKKDSEEINKVSIRIGREVTEKLGWEIGDKICIFHHPDDLMSFMLVRTDNGNGWKLSHESNTTLTRLTFKWDRPLKLEKRSYQPVDFLIPKDQYIVFRVDA